jgi:uncharacterized membrane protein YfcA
MSLEHWYLLPVGFGIAVLAMSSGVSAGNFWVPVYLLWARFEPALAFWMALATMLCGYGSGVVRNLRQGTLNGRVIRQYLPLTVPAALVGGYLAPAVEVSWLIALFGGFVLGYGARLLAHPARQPATSPRSGLLASLGERAARPGVALLGGALLGLIAVGLGELMLPRLLADRKLEAPAAAVGSTVLVIFATSLAAALIRLPGGWWAALGEQRTTLLGALLFAAPAVIAGGQLGPRLARRLDAGALRRYVGVVLVLVGLLMLVRFAATAGVIG